MPVEVEPTSQIEDVMRVMRKRIGYLLVPLSLCLALGTSFAFLVPKKFVAEERVMVRDVGDRENRQAGTSGGQVASHVIRAPKRVKAVIEELNWQWDSLSKEEQEVLLDRTIDNLKVSSPALDRSSKEQIVTISFAHTDPIQALKFTTTISRLWQDEVLLASRTATKAAFDTLKERRDQMQARLSEISTELSDKHDQYGIPPWDTAAWGERELAPEFKELEELRAERKRLAEESIQLGFDIEELEVAFAKMDDQVPFTATAAGQTFQKSVDKLQELIDKDQLRLVTEGYRPGHSKYTLLQDRIASYKEGIALLKATQVGSTLPTDMQQNMAKLKLGEQIRLSEQQLDRTVARIEALDDVDLREAEANTTQLQAVYQELHLLQAERQRLNGNLAAVEDDYTRMEVLWTEMDSSAGNPFHILKQASLPVIPTEPSVIMIILGSAVLGLALGLGSGFLAEYGRNCFRTVNDITRVMVVPVLGTINTIVTPRERRRAGLSRLLVGGSTLLVIVALGFVTYAWELNQDLLSDNLRTSIESFRRAFE